MPESEGVPQVGEIVRASRSAANEHFEDAEVLARREDPALGTTLEVKFVVDGHRLEIAWPSPAVERR